MTKTRKTEIIDALPDNFINELRAELYSYYYDAQVYFGKTPERMSAEEEERFIRGRIFEMFILYDREIQSEAENAQNNTPNLRTSMLPASDEILTLMQNPKRFNLGEDFAQLRNPDALYTHISKKGTLLIDGNGEAKLGHLNERAINQLELFPKNIKRICDLLNSKPEFKNIQNLRRAGLENLSYTRWALGDEGDIILMNPKFKQYLILPANRDIDKKPNENDAAYKERLFKELVSKDLHDNADIKARFMAVLDTVELKRAAFNVKEVSALAAYVYSKINALEEYEAKLAEKSAETV